MFPGPTCTGKPAIDAEGEACGFDWTTLEVESFDIPLNTKALKVPRG